jgi:superfamily II DNA/RNA helicase
LSYRSQGDAKDCFRDNTMTQFDTTQENFDAASNEAASFDHSAAQGADAPANGFESLNLNHALLKAVQELGYTEPTGVQAETIPAALNGGDWMVSSQTGSGKTAAFLLPAIHALLAAPPMSKGEEFARKRRAAASPRVLVLAPTRELAQQVAQEAISLVRFCKGVRIANVVGGTAFGKQLMDLRGASLVVATPGRLLDLNRNGQIDLNAVQTLVVDEADRMLDLGFSEDLEAIHVATMQRERTMMFSATFAPRIMELASHVMRNPQRIELATAQDTHENIEQRLHWFDDIEHKNKLLEHYLADEAMEQAVVFTATQIEADELADELRDAGYSASALHGAMPQALRNRRIKSLREGTVKILVATDVAARGIDVPTISHVINYGLPMKPEDYVHRIGRTGRAGRNGFAVTLAGARDRYRIRNIEHFTQQRIDSAVIEGLEPQTNPQQGFARGGGRRFGGRNDSFGGRDKGFADRGRRFGDRDDRAPRGERSFGAESAPQSSAPAFAREERSSLGDAARPQFNPPARPFNDAPRFNRERPSEFARAPRREFASPYSNSAQDARPRDGRFERDTRDTRGGGERDGRNDFSRGNFARSNDSHREFAPRDRSQREGFRSDAPRGNDAWQARGSYADRGERGFGEARVSPSTYAPREEKVFAHQSRAERRGDKPAGPAITPSAPGGNRAARRAHLAAEFAARAAAENA